MTDYKFIKFEKADGVARITLARPKHNVMNIEMMNEFNLALDDIHADQDLKCLIILADGPSWCAGVEVADHKPAQVDEMIATFNGIFERMHRLEITTIACVHGACLGGGMEVAIACDVIVAAQGAMFGQPEIKLGFFPPYAAVRLPQLVGPAKAIEICTAGKRYTAAQAQQMGFVAHVVENQQLVAATNALAEELQACSPLIIRLNKRAVKQHLRLSFQEALTGVSDLFLNTLMKTEDTLEGIASFEKRRKPVWKNR